jgi:hypothetical protein
MMGRSLLLGGFILGAVLVPGMALAGHDAPSKLDVCHLDEEGFSQLINVSERSLPAHLAHGDGLPGEGLFREDCTRVVVEEGDLLDVGGAGVRYKGDNTGNEIYLGIPDLGVGGNRVEEGFGWVDGTYDVTFAFDATNNKVTTSIDGPGGSTSLEYDFDDLLPPGCATAEWNALYILLRDDRDDGGLELNNIVLTPGNFDLGDFGTLDVLGTPGFLEWTVTGYDFTQSFTVSADLVIQNYVGNEALRMEILVGCLP